NVGSLRGPMAEQSARDPGRYLLASYWDAALGFWRRGAGSTAWVLSALIVVLAFVNLALQYRLNVWNRAMFDALDHKDGSAVLRQSLIFLPLNFGIVCIAATSVYARMTTQQPWRTSLNGHDIGLWTSSGRYYQLNLVPGDHQNPEYRVAEDLRLSCEAPVDFAAGILSAVLSAVTFIGVLWSIGGTLTVTLGGRTLEIPAFLVITAIVYPVLASRALAVIGRRLLALAPHEDPPPPH